MTLNMETAPTGSNAGAAFETIPTGAALGAEVRAGDLRALDNAGFAHVLEAWHAHSVVLFREQTLSDHDLIAHDNGGSGAAVIRSDQFGKGLLVHADVLNLKCDPFLRKVGLSPCTWRSTGSTEHDYFLLHPLSSKLDLTARAAAVALRRDNFSIASVPPVQIRPLRQDGFPW